MSDLFDEKNISPMLLGEEKEPFDDDDYIYELKLDGIRCIAYLEKGRVSLRNKRNKDVSEIYPELSEIWRNAKRKCILDGELVAFTDGKPDFYAVQKRSLMTDAFRIGFAAKRNPVQFVAFDMLYAGKTQITDEPLMERKELLEHCAAKPIYPAKQFCGSGADVRAVQSSDADRVCLLRDQNFLSEHQARRHPARADVGGVAVYVLRAARIFGRVHAVDETGRSDLSDGVHADDTALSRAHDVPEQHAAGARHHACSERGAAHRTAVRVGQLCKV